MKKWIFLFITSFFLLSQPATGMTFRKYDLSNGLSNNSVLCLIQASDGFIWIGTRDGLCRYDGVNFTIFRQNFDDPGSLSNNSVNCIYEARDGDLWIGTTMGLNRYSKKTGTFQSYFKGDNGRGLSNNYVRSVIQTDNGNFLIGTPSGIDIFSPETSVFKRLGIPKRADGKDNGVLCFYKDRKGTIWAGLRNGLYKIEDETVKRAGIVSDPVLSGDITEVRDIREDSDGKLWIATEQEGVLILDNLPAGLKLSSQFTVENSRIISNHIRKIYFTDREIWFGTMEGLSILNRSSGSFLNMQYSDLQKEGISNNSIRDIMGDNQGGIWLATYAGGINYYHPENSRFKHVRLSEENDRIISNVVSGFIEDDNSNLWIATEGGGLLLKKRESNQTIHYLAQEGVNSLIHNNIKSITADRSGNIWIGTYNGLSYLEVRTGRFTNFLNEPGCSNCLVFNQIHSIVVDNEGLVWLGTNGGGVQTYDPVRKLFRTIDLPGVKNVNVMIRSSNNRIWIGHQAGLVSLDPLTHKEIDLSPLFNQLNITVQYVQSLYEDRKGRIWIGTQGFGLFLIDGDKIVAINSRNGLPSNTINAVTEDNDGFFWITTNKGLTRIPNHFSGDNPEKSSLKNYSSSEGLELQYVPMSVLRSKQGEIYFGSINGYNRFNPRDVQDRDFFPKVVLTDVRVRSDEKKPKSSMSPLYGANRDGMVELTYEFRDISVDFLGINYVNPGNTFYRYRLVGIDKDWVSLGSQHTLSFNYLPVGKYDLQISASTNPLLWDNNYLSLKIVILPPWWLTGWAFALYLLLLIALLTLFFSFSKRWVNLNNKLAMEHFQREKEEELHQMKLKFFTDVSHELRTPLTLIVSPLEQIIRQPDLNSRLKNQLTLIQLNGSRMMRLINKVLDLRRLDAGYERLEAAGGDLVRFMKETGLAFGETASSKKINFEFVSDEEQLMVYFDRDKMEMILYNLLSNAIKNSQPGGSITLGLRKGEMQSLSTPGLKQIPAAVLTVSDTGRGIPKEIQERIFERYFVASANGKRMPVDSGVGLEITRRLVALHKGSITLDSRERTEEADGYTCFTLCFPLGSDHLSDEEIIHEFKNSEDSSLYSTERVENEMLEEIDFETVPGGKEKDVKKEEEKLKLLVVEDNREVRQFIVSLFNDEYSVDEAENGQEGVTKATAILPDLILCDVMMPVMDGMELCRIIKSDIRTSHIPVILLTARTALTFRYEGLETGADDYITKPFSAGYLQLRVRNLIRQREALRNHFTLEMICDPAKITVTSVDEKLLKKAVEYIGLHMSDPAFSVEKLSSELGFSRVHFYRKIKALTNLTAVEFVRSIRLKRAAALLKENKINVNEISAMVGFEDVDYFRSCFKQQYGVSPSEFAKINMADKIC